MKEVGTYSDSVASEYQSGHNHARWAAALLGLVAILSLLQLVSNLMQAALLDQLAAGVKFTQEQLAANDTRHEWIVNTWSLAYLGCVVAYCLWFFRACRNAVALGILMDYSPGRAVWNWFIPFVNLVTPFRTVRDLWESSAIPRSLDQPRESATGWLRVWWGLWLTAGIANRIVSSLLRTAKDLDDYRRLVRSDMVENVLYMGAALLALWLVLGIARRQDELYRHQALQAR